MANKSNDYNDAMHPHFEHDHRQQQSNSQTSDTLDSLKRDRWELLNAYIDSEVTPKEKRMVERWLEEDQKMQCLYARLLQLRCHVQAVPVPSNGTSVEAVVQNVCRRIDRERIRRNFMIGGAVIVALLSAVVANNVPSLHEATNVIEREELNLRLDQTLIPDSEGDSRTTP